jgi:hypothetical protein
VLLLGTILVVEAYVVVPALIEDLLARNLQTRLGLESTPGIELEGSPASLLTGRFDGGSADLPGLELGGMRPEETSVELAPFELDVPGSLTSGSMRTQPPLSGTLRVELSEPEVARVAGLEATSFPVNYVDLEKDVVVIGSEAVAFGRSIPVSVQGGLDLQDNSLVFEPSTVEALGVQIPEPLTGQLLQGTSFVYPIDPLPDGIRFTNVEVQRDQLLLTGETNNLAVG